MMTADSPSATPNQIMTVTTEAPRVRTPPLRWTPRLVAAFDEAVFLSGGDRSSYTGTTPSAVWHSLMESFADEEVQSLTLLQVAARLSNARRRLRSLNQSNQEATLNGPFAQEAALNEHVEQEAFLSSTDQTATSPPTNMRVTCFAGAALKVLFNVFCLFVRAAPIVFTMLPQKSSVTDLMVCIPDFPVWDRLSVAAKLVFAFLHAYTTSAVKTLFTGLCPAVHCLAPAAPLMLPAA